MALKMIHGRDVQLFDGELKRREQENRDYMLRLETRALMLNFEMEAGLAGFAETPEYMHGGWENPFCQLRGHFPGHWLSAAAMRWYASGDRAVKAQADDMIDILENRYGCKDIRLVCLIAAKPGVERVMNAHPNIKLYCAALDETLNEHAYIVPGLGIAPYYYPLCGSRRQGPGHDYRDAVQPSLLRQLGFLQRGQQQHPTQGRVSPHHPRLRET